jgi:hypothetical protein
LSSAPPAPGTVTRGDASTDLETTPVSAADYAMYAAIMGGASAILSTLSPADREALAFAKKVDAGPTVDGTMKPVWQGAKPLAVKLNGGRNLPGGSTEVSLRAVYDANKIYFLAQWADPTKSERRFPFVKQQDGSWKQLKDANDKGGDDNQYYEDKFAMIWAIKSPSIERNGCFAGCHLGETKPFGNKYLPAGETGDIWHWKSIRTGSVGQIDDQYLDDTKYDKEKAPEAGRKSDKKDGAWRTIQVDVSNKDLKVRARQGYRALPRGGAAR